MVEADAPTRQISIRSKRDGDDVELVIADTGPGFQDKELESSFDAFVTTKSNGLGMGLSISRSIIEAHRGRLWAETNAVAGSSNDETTGAAIHVRLPIRQGDA